MKENKNYIKDLKPFKYLLKENEDYQKTLIEFQDYIHSLKLSRKTRLGFLCDNYMEKLRNSNILGVYGYAYDALYDDIYDNEKLIVNPYKNLNKKKSKEYKKVIKRANHRLRKKFDEIIRKYRKELLEGIRQCYIEDGFSEEEITRKKCSDVISSNLFRYGFLKLMSTYLVRMYCDKDYKKDIEWIALNQVNKVKFIDEQQTNYRLMNFFENQYDENDPKRYYVCRRMKVALKNKHVSQLTLRVLSKANMILHVGSYRKTDTTDNGEFITLFSSTNKVKFTNEKLKDDILSLESYIKEHHMWGIREHVDINKKKGKRYLKKNKIRKERRKSPLYLKFCKKCKTKEQKRNGYIFHKNNLFGFIDKYDNDKFKIIDIELNNYKYLSSSEKKEYFKSAKYIIQYKKVNKKISVDVKYNKKFEKGDIYKVKLNDVKKYNKLLKKTKISFDKDYSSKYINTSEMKHVTRIFREKNKHCKKENREKFQFECGGRYYSKLQQLNKLDRLYLDINNQETVEIDYESLHPTILYAKYKLDVTNEELYKIDKYPEVSKNDYKRFYLSYKYESDFFDNCNYEYNSNKYSRKDIKTATFIVLNSKNQTSCASSIKKHIENVTDIEDAYKLLFGIILRHNKILHKKSFDEYLWGYLQNKESEISTYIINHFTNKNIPILNIHDSFICQNKYKDELYNIMIDAFKNTLNVDIKPNISIKDRHTLYSYDNNELNDNEISKSFEDNTIDNSIPISEINKLNKEYLSKNKYKDIVEKSYKNKEFKIFKEKKYFNNTIVDKSFELDLQKTKKSTHIKDYNKDNFQDDIYYNNQDNNNIDYTEEDDGFQDDDIDLGLDNQDKDGNYISDFDKLLFNM